MRINTLFVTAALVVAAGCGKSDGGGKPAPGGKGGAAKPPADDVDAVVDHSQEALATVKDTVGGVSFSIDLPAGLEKEQRDRDISHYDNWTYAKGNPFLEPSITVQILDGFGFPADLDAAVREATMITGDEQRTVATQKATPQGFLVSTQRPDGQFLEVQAWAKQGDHVATASFIQRTGTGQPDDRPIPSLDATRAWAETIVASLHLD